MGHRRTGEVRRTEQSQPTNSTLQAHHTNGGKLLVDAALDAATVSPFARSTAPIPTATHCCLPPAVCAVCCQIFYTHAVAAIIVYDITARSAITIVGGER